MVNSLPTEQIAVPLDVCFKELYDEDFVCRVDLSTTRKILDNVIQNPEELKFRSLNSIKLLPRLVENSLVCLYILYHAGFVKDGDRLILPSSCDINRVTTVCQQLSDHVGLMDQEYQKVQSVQNEKNERANQRVAEQRQERLQREAQEKEDRKVQEEAKALELERRKVEREVEEKRKTEERLAKAEKERQDTIAKYMSEGKSEDEALSIIAQIQADEEMAIALAKEMESSMNVAPKANASSIPKKGKHGDEEEDDPELLRLAEEIRKKRYGGSVSNLKPTLASAKDVILTEQDKEHLKQLTEEEKRVFMNEKQTLLREKNKAEELKANVSEEMRRIEHTKMLQNVQEQREETERRQAIEKQKKQREEDNRNRAAMHKQDMKLKEDKERRIKEHEERKLELQKIREQQNK